MSVDEFQVRRLGARKKRPQSGSMVLRHWFAIVLSACVLGMAVAVSTSAGPLEAIFSRIASASFMSQGSPEHAPPATTVVGRETRWCRRVEFDNENGRIFQTNAPCDGEALDANGNPVPVGTMKRLDAISKSFFGR